MPLIVQPKIHAVANAVSNGVYPAKLTDIRQFQNSYGDRIGFEFTLQGGDMDGLIVMQSTSTNLSAQSKLAELLCGLLGHNFGEHELVSGLDVEELVGTECKVLVMQSMSKGGHIYSSVEQVFR